MLAVNFQGIFTQLEITIIILMITKIVITITIMVMVKVTVIIIGVVNGKYEPLQDGETSIFLCQTETFLGLLIARPQFRLQNGFVKNSRL